MLIFIKSNFVLSTCPCIYIYIYIYIYYIYIYIYIIYIYIYIYINIYYIFTTEGLLEVAIESWPEWDLSPQPQSSPRRSNRLSYQAMSSTRTQSQLCIATAISSFVQCPTSFRLLPSLVVTFTLIEILKVYKKKIILELSFMTYNI